MRNSARGATRRRLRMRAWLEPWLLTVVSALVAGAACGCVMAYLLGHHPINWSVTAELLQFAAISVTGYAAFRIARAQIAVVNRQRDDLIEAQRVKLALRVLDDIYREVKVLGQPQSLVQAYGTLQLTCTRPEDFARYCNLRDRYVTSQLRDLAEDDDSRFYIEVRDAAGVVNNYFTILWDLYDRNLIDRRLVLDKVGPWARDCYEYVMRLGDHSDHKTAKFKMMAEAGSKDDLSEG
jgi:hypothetical protein